MTVPDTCELVERAPETMMLLVCPVCGRNDRFNTIGIKRHSTGGKACNGTPVAVSYALAARVEKAERERDEAIKTWRKHVHECFQREERAEARVEELTEALERSENDWTFLFNLADYSDLAPEVLRALAKVNLERARAVLVRESGGQP